MNRISTALLAAVMAATPVIATATVAEAGGKNYYRGRPVPPPNNNWQGVGAGLAAGAALGLGAGLLLNNRPPPPPAYYPPPPPPVYYAPPPPPPVVYYPAPPPAYYAPPPPPPVAYNGYGPAHVQWCLNRYRSYNPATNTFTGYDGYQHQCVGPY